jgi:hypothetical protein
MVSPFVYSVRNATIGSTFVARRAGIQQATNATPASSNVTPPKVSGSVAVTPNKKNASARVIANAPASPTITPISVSFKPCETTSRSTSRPCAQRHANADFVCAPRHGARHHGINSRRRQQQRHQREDAEHPRQHALRRTVFVNHLWQGFDPRDGQRAIQRAHFTAHGAGQRQWLLIRVNDQVHRPPRRLRVGQVDRRVGLFFQIVVLHIGDDADDFQCFVAAELQAFADGFMAGEKPARHRLVDELAQASNVKFAPHLLRAAP